MKQTLKVFVWNSILLFFLILSSFPTGSWAETPPSPNSGEFKIFLLLSQLGNPYGEIRETLVDSLRTYGYQEGKNLFMKLQASGNDIQKGEKILREEVGNNYDVIFVCGTAATISGKNVLYGKKQKVVFAAPTDPVGIGVIKNFTSAPDANFTGVCYPVPVKARLKFMMQLMPKAKTFGLIYADMPQSHSYNQWIEDLLNKDPAFKNLKVIFRSVDLVTGEDGDKIMAQSAVSHIKELDSQVDAFIKPCDQMGTRRQFSEVVYQTATKPLIGITKDDVMDHWGAAATMYPSHESIGKQAARMIKEIFEGKSVRSITPEWPREFGVAFDLKKTKAFGIHVPIAMLQMAGRNIVR